MSKKLILFYGIVGDYDGAYDELAKKDYDNSYYSLGFHKGGWHPSDDYTVVELVGDDCIWKYDDTHDVWETSCGNAFCLEDGSPTHNELNYCPYCGGNLKEEI